MKLLAAALVLAAIASEDSYVLKVTVGGMS